MRHRRFRFLGDLRQFLAPPLRALDGFQHSAPESDSLKHVIESLGVPHTEFGQLDIDGDVVVVHPAPAERLGRDACFLLDGHLGRLAAYLRMTGIDAAWQPHPTDEELAARSRSEQRVLLTRDVGLLKRNEVWRGYFVRATDPRAQLTEVVRRFGLVEAFSPFTRCLRCNAVLEPLDEPGDRVPPRARAQHDEFRECPVCRRVYWRGSHYQRMAEWVEALKLAELRSPG